MASGGAAAAPGPAPTGAPAPAGNEPAQVIPEKYLVKNEDGTTNHEATSLKVAQAHAALEKRMGAGEAPPKDADSYQLDLPQGLSMDTLKDDPLFAGFLKGAHTRGLNNAQVSYLVGEFQQRIQLLEEQRNSPDVGAAELRKIWQTDQQMSTGLSRSFKGTQAFAEDQDHAARLDKKFGNDPDFIRLMAKVGSELGEDKPVQGVTQVDVENREALMRSEAYNSPNHPEHAATVAKVKASYERQYAGQ
ncbi:hypothetical protein [Roseateles aquatilis]|nr:hypothetical protein [Roseateles aquatilis]